MTRPVIRATVITVSDEVVNHTDDDRAGALAERLLAALAVDVARMVVPDDPTQLLAAVSSAIADGSRLVMTCGGTGIGPADRTSDAVAELLTFQIPGIAEEIRRRGIAHAAPAVVSREIAGVIVRAGEPSVFVLCAPGSRGGVQDAVDVIGPVLPYIFAELDGR
ncbi:MULTISPECIES: MogA/MoaB family molybdenum cofactor biosynthesis protein [Aestuariimicrobium]|uniref:MogA/MoaB family molybdenum cofactor biosynthesis protein n=1 Tax=Aestuariimicrobium TaxID=396388 RepID=UPI000686C7B9|nr:MULTISPECIES: molybdopterin-binding protein [Aestuariimicrobium]CAI9410621.1 Molybdenum cofactor biosynthesis protein B [Aestuariimicrobium sp. T2.26MG-19.2B]